MASLFRHPAWDYHLIKLIRKYAEDFSIHYEAKEGFLADFSKSYEENMSRFPSSWVRLLEKTEGGSESAKKKFEILKELMVAQQKTTIVGGLPQYYGKIVWKEDGTPAFLGTYFGGSGELMGIVFKLLDL